MISWILFLDISEHLSESLRYLIGNPNNHLYAWLRLTDYSDSNIIKI